MEISEFLRPTFNGIQFNSETVYVTWVLIVLATIGFILMSKKFSIIPTKIQTAFEMLIDFFDKQTVEMMGEKGKTYTPLIFFVFFTVLIFNWMGLLPCDLKVGHFLVCAPPTRDINTTLALALCSFCLFNYFGIKEKGLKYLAHFIEPAPEVAKNLPPYLIWLIVPLTLLFVVLNIMEIFARVLSLSVRLFCNVMGEHIVAASLIMFTLLIFQMLLPLGFITYGLPLFVYLLGIFTGAVQAFIFAVLTLSYISLAVAESH